MNNKISTLEVNNENKKQSEINRLQVELEILETENNISGDKSEMISWFNFQLFQWENGYWAEVNVNQPPVNNTTYELGLHYEPRYKKEWFPAPIDFTSFMDWKMRLIMEGINKKQI